MGLVIKGSSSGQVTVDVPATAGTNTLTLPASTGTVAQTTTGLIEVDMFRLTTTTSDGANADITANLERCDDASFAKIGTGMSESSGIFSFPRTGVYEVKVQAFIDAGDGDGTCEVRTQVTQNNSDYDAVAIAVGGDDAGTNGMQTSAYSQCFVNCTDTSNVKVKFTTVSFGSSSHLEGNSNNNRTTFSFIRLGDA